MVPRRSPSSCLAVLAGGVAALVSPSSASAAEACQVLRYTFQPDCYRDAASTTCIQSVNHLDLRPQIAVWLESADGTQFIDTLMVSNLTAKRGIGNRPGRWDFLSAPKFPYGKRQMALPVWAHARGKLYPMVVMQESSACSDSDCESWLGWHEATSSPEPYFCVPLPANGDRSVQSDINMGQKVDAISCPSVFNSSKGKLTSATSYYPPRTDLDPNKFVSLDCDIQGGSIDSCNLSARQYASMNDLDAVAAATPPYGGVFSATWTIPTNLPAGDYAVLVEVNKEYDYNASHDHPSFIDTRLPSNGIPRNFGQPSVVYRVPIHIDSAATSAVAVSQIAGYGDWTGATGDLNPRDGTISTSNPGSGEARLLEISGPGGTGRVHVNTEGCEPVVCEPLPPAPGTVTALQATSVGAFSADITFVNASSNGQTVRGYDIRFRNGDTMTDDEFAAATPTQVVVPAPPGTMASFTVIDLKPRSNYMIGVRSLGPCDQQSGIATLPITTDVAKFTQLSGCFVATAAYGSDLEPHVASLRHARDRLRAGSPLFAAVTDLYYGSGPAAAELLRRSDTARAVVRRVLAPAASLAEAADAALTALQP